ncbi:MAG: NAD(P)-dependent glycerol-3-phosphate dehydrogenase [Fimbriiglobus sp.]|jgi:glycerol-3-phosphate dehydrogenase (NAD(P)+)|nr:NAD(P)-dependent glycerol-3-phosphate dehydrogenase [Fimbriiglobus sp.]
MPEIAVIGAGGWGTAVAVTLAQKPDVRVRLLCTQEASGREILAKRENVPQLPGVRIPDTVTITLSPEEALTGADGWLVAIPTAYLRTALARFRPFTRPDLPVISLTKGIEVDTFRRPTEILSEMLGVKRLCVLSGPSHAEEVARGQPTSVVAASPDAELAAWVQRHVGGERLRVYTNADLIGVELAGALKNVLGIAAGLCDGLNFGDNTKSALLTRGLVEMQRFGVTHGASPETFFGLAGVGDLITTCFSPHGRNRRVGERIARGEKLDEVLRGPMVAEGVLTARSVYERVTRAGLYAPILTAVYRVLYEGRPPLEVASELLDRPQKGEQ